LSTATDTGAWTTGTRRAPVLLRTVEGVQAELDRLDAFEAEFSTPSRKIRRQSLTSELYALAEKEIVDNSKLQQDIADADLALTALYDAAIEAIANANAAVEAVQSVRHPYDDLWRQGVRAGLDVPVRVPKSDVRMSSSREWAEHVYKMRAWSSVAW